MYKAFFNLNCPPFSITPNPRFLFLSPRHKEALAHLHFGIQASSGFVLLTGEVGTGKTTLSRCLIERTGEDVDVALIFNPKLSATELVASICDELKIDYPKGEANMKVLYDALNDHLLTAFKNRRNTVLIVDEAQSLSFELLEQIRLLSNLETATRKLLKIVLVGQPELLDILSRPELRQFGQRITARYHITTLNCSETAEYVYYRLKVAGSQAPIFTKFALWLVHYYSKGTPRLINTICDRALLGAYARGQTLVTSTLVRESASEILLRSRLVAWKNPFTTAALVTIVLFGLWFFLPKWSPVLSSFPVKVGGGWTEMTRSVGQWVVSVGESLAQDPSSYSQPESSALSRNTTPSKKIDPVSQKINPVSPLEVLVSEHHSKTEDGDESINTPLSVQPVPISPPLKSILKLESLLVDEAYPTQMWVALSGLFGLWQQDQPNLPKKLSCESAPKVGLKCVNLTGNWNTLQRLNAPVVIKLIAQGIGEHYVLLSTFGAKKVLIRFGKKEVELEREQLDRFWSGHFTLVFRQSPNHQSFLWPNSEGSDISWMRQALAGVMGSDGLDANKDESELARFDPALRDRLIQFQREHLLDADGIMGPLTLFTLDKMIKDPKRPVLIFRSDTKILE